MGLRCRSCYSNLHINKSCCSGYMINTYCTLYIPVAGLSMHEHFSLWYKLISQLGITEVGEGSLLRLRSIQNHKAHFSSISFNTLSNCWITSLTISTSLMLILPTSLNGSWSTLSRCVETQGSCYHGNHTTT